MDAYHRVYPKVAPEANPAPTGYNSGVTQAREETDRWTI